MVIRGHPWWCTFYGLDTCMLTCIHHYRIIQSILTALKILYAPPIHLSLLPSPWQPLTLLLSPQFCLLQKVIELESNGMQPFQIGFLHSEICTSVSTTSFHDLLVHSFPVLNNIPVSVFTTVYLSIHLLKDILDASKVWQLWLKLFSTPMCKFLCGHKFSAALGNTKEHSCWIVWSRYI